ncbi:16S rRNA (cytidine(1402)-2'-O)-methyltransferase [Candidatus Woesearchaeota archaeon]|nr:16S rRNA (cytidine(1402)-2'-O)-methyltransferase [Candidatus Woesearchaeota archaeon]
MTLYIVSTPTGNLQDITLRALDVLRSVQLIACEDTRQTRKLLARFSISAKLEPYHDKNERHKSKHLLNLLKAGLDIALVSDSGTPLLSDPGYHIVKLAAENDIRIVPVPGASAMLSALVCSGFSLQEFSFYGFFPKKQKSQMEIIEKIKSNKVTVLYESPHRVQRTMELLKEHIPDMQIVIARELTKVHEEFIRGRIIDVCQEISQHPLKGEIVLVIS